jgi:uncharacterized protein involved in exopolysaccharide biosynthesis
MRARISPSSADLNLIRIVLRYLKTRRRRTATVLGLSFAACLAALLAMPTKYTATATFIPEARRGIGGVTGLASQFGLTIPGAEPNVTADMFTELLRSRQLLDGVISRDYEFHEGPEVRRIRLSEYFAPGERNESRRQHNAIKRLSKAVRVSADRRTSIVRLGVQTSSADLSLKVVRAMLDALAEFNLALRRGSAKNERSFFEARVAEARRELTDAEHAMSSFLARNRSFQQDPQLIFQHDRLERQVSLKQTLYTTLAQAYEQARMEEVRTTPTVTIIDQPSVPPHPDGLPLPLKIVASLVVSACAAIAWALLAVFGRALALDHRSVSDGVGEYPSPSLD